MRALRISRYCISCSHSFCKVISEICEQKLEIELGRRFKICVFFVIENWDLVVYLREVYLGEKK